MPSPFGDYTIGGAPDGIFPGMTDGSGFPDPGFVDFNTETGQFVAVNETVFVFEHGGIGEVVKEIGALIVVDTERLFLNNGIGGTPVELQTGGESDGTERTMRSDGDIVTLCHSGDLADFEDTAGVTEVRLNDICDAAGISNPPIWAFPR